MITTEDLQGSGSLLTFDDVQEEVEQLADLNYPDKVVDMTHTHVTPELDFSIPGIGVLEMTDWSRRQISQALGIKWNKWFEGVSHQDAQAELQRRFSYRSDSEFLIRSRRHQEPTARNNGVLRGFLGPKYSTIDDRRILQCLRSSRLGDHLDEISFVRWSRNMITDRSTHITGIVGDATNIPIGDQEEEYYHGFHLRNSEVGFSSITIDDFWFRILCLNGMLALIGNKSLYRQRHVNVTDENVADSLGGLWVKLMDRKERVEEALEDSATEELQDPLLRLRAFLRKKNVAKYLIERATNLYEEDPVSTRYGLVQTITAAAKDIANADDRMELERIGGQFLLAAA